MKFLISLLAFLQLLAFGSSSIGPAEEKSLVYLHPRFDFTAEDMASRLPHLPDSALENSEDFLELAFQMLKLPDFYLRLVDKSHSLPEEFIPPDLVPLVSHEDIKTAWDNLLLDARTAEALSRMSAEASSNGVDLVVSSAYRSFDHQLFLFRHYREIHGMESARRFSAPAGASQHQLGTTVDFGNITEVFGDTLAGHWLTMNAGRFGWSRSYPDGMESETGYIGESWHWRWIGPQAIQMQERYFDGMQHRLLEFWHSQGAILRLALRRDDTIYSSDNTS